MKAGLTGQITMDETECGTEGVGLREWSLRSREIRVFLQGKKMS